MENIELEEKIYINTKDNETNDDDSNLNLLPKFNMMEPNENDAILEWAENNIGENPDRKIELIEELRDMIFERGECEPHRTDDAFLLRFLRARHFIVRMAHRLFEPTLGELQNTVCHYPLNHYACRKESFYPTVINKNAYFNKIVIYTIRDMVNYCHFRKTNPELFYNIDYNKLLEVGDSEIFSIPPYVDENGRRILIVRFEKWDPSQLTTDELFQTIIFLIQTAILEPKYQILGGICIIDVSNLGAGHAWYLTPTIAKQLVAVAYSSLPHRVQAVHVVNASRIFDYAFGMIKPFLLDIMKERIFIHPDMESLHKHMSPKYLPKRFGGTHKDYLYNDWLTVLKENDKFFEEMESYGYENCREFVQNI